MSDWSDAAVWEGGGLRREVCYLRSGEAEVFVSTWGPLTSAAFALLVCPPWGFEGSTSADLQTGIAHEAARRGGLGVVFHYPGHGDSTGDERTATVETMVRAAVDTARAVSDRFAGELMLAGLRLGASVAVLAAADLHPARVLVVDEELDPASYFSELARRARRASLAYPGSKDLAFGVPLSDAVARSGQGAASALRALDCPVTALHHRDFAGRTPLGHATVDADAQWLVRAPHRQIVAAAARWLDGAAVAQP
jgi:pimeloyl-ACP methyl ester carboxylesterase